MLLGRRPAFAAATFAPRPRASADKLARAVWLSSANLAVGPADHTHAHAAGRRQSIRRPARQAPGKFGAGKLAGRPRGAPLVCLCRARAAGPSCRLFGLSAASCPNVNNGPDRRIGPECLIVPGGAAASRRARGAPRRNYRARKRAGARMGARAGRPTLPPASSPACRPTFEPNYCRPRTGPARPMAKLSMQQGARESRWRRARPLRA